MDDGQKILTQGRKGIARRSRNQRARAGKLVAGRWTGKLKTGKWEKKCGFEI
jgi:hypothetical protein